MKKNKIAMTIKLGLLMACVVLVAFAGGIFDGFFSPASKDKGVTISQEEYALLQKYAKMEEVFQYVEAYYYQEPNREQMMELAIQGMLAGLEDPYTFYYNNEAWKALWEDDEGKYAGIGIQILGDFRDGSVTVTRLFKGSPAADVGLHKGDLLIRVEELGVDAFTMQEAVDIMRGTPGEMVEIEVDRKGEKITFNVPRAEITVNWTDHKMLPDNVGYIALYEFSGDCTEKIEIALEELIAKGATSLILDLRDNHGGWVDDAIGIADFFVDRQELFYRQGRDGSKVRAYTEDGKIDLPLVVLVNESSASASEIVSGGLQEQKRATVVGQTTYGKGVVQAVVPLMGNDDGIQLTTEEYFFPSGTKVHEVGVTPDIFVTMPEEMMNVYLETGDLSDPQVQKALETAVALREGTPLPTSEPMTVETTENIKE